MSIFSIIQSKLIDIRYVLALITMLIASIKRTKSYPTTFITAFLILYLAYGLKHTLFIAGVLAINLFLVMLNSKALNEYFFIVLNIFVLYFYKWFGLYIEPSIQTTYDISGFLMLLVVKSSYLAGEYHKTPIKQPATAVREKNENTDSDTLKNPNVMPNEDALVRNTTFVAETTPTINNSNNESRINQMSIPSASLEKAEIRKANMLDAAHFLLFIPGLLSGPTPTFSEFMAANKTASTPFPKRRFAQSILFLSIYTIFRGIPFKAYILDENTSLGMKLLFLYLFNFVMRNKFHFIWNYADVCFALHGFNGLLNIDFYKVECCESVREISANWNKFVSRWLKTLFFIRLKDRSMRTAVIVTHLASACLHGFNPCYLLFFMAFGIFSHVVTRFNKLIPFKLLRQLQMVLFVSFFSMPFYLLSLQESYEIMKALKFVGWIYFGGLLAAFNIYDILKMYSD